MYFIISFTFYPNYGWPLSQKDWKQPNWRMEKWQQGKKTTTNRWTCTHWCHKEKELSPNLSPAKDKMWAKFKWKLSRIQTTCFLVSPLNNRMKCLVYKEILVLLQCRVGGGDKFIIIIVTLPPWDGYKVDVLISSHSEWWRVNVLNMNLVIFLRWKLSINSFDTPKFHILWMSVIGLYRKPQPKFS